MTARDAEKVLTEYLLGTFGDPPHSWSLEMCETEARDILTALEAAGYKVLTAQDIVDGMLASKTAGEFWPLSPSRFVRAAFDAAPTQRISHEVS